MYSTKTYKNLSLLTFFLSCPYICFFLYHSSPARVFTLKKLISKLTAHWVMSRPNKKKSVETHLFDMGFYETCFPEIFSFWAYVCRDIYFLMFKNNSFSHGNEVAIFPRQQHVPILHYDRSKLKYDWFDYINFAADNTSSWDVLSLQLISAWLASWPGSEQFSTLLPLLAFLQSHAFCKLTRAFQECQAILKVLATYRCHDINIRHAELHTQLVYMDKIW